jgi:predicted lipoprotein with Yx(FWY)xxD motif
LAVRESSELGRYVTDVDGRPIYVPLVDAHAAWSCTGDCERAWTPVSGPALNSDVDEPAIQLPLIRTRQRSDGGLQLTYADRPLYYAGPGASDAPARIITDPWGTWSLLFPHGEPMAPPP